VIKPALTAYAPADAKPAITNTVIGNTPRRATGFRSAQSNKTVQPSMSEPPSRMAYR
jgi:hypothetical protein